jgi:hypothetical protein
MVGTACFACFLKGGSDKTPGLGYNRNFETGFLLAPLWGADPDGEIDGDDCNPNP